LIIPFPNSLRGLQSSLSGAQIALNEFSSFVPNIHFTDKELLIEIGGDRSVRK